MKNFEELKVILKKFIDKKYNVEDLSQTLSSIAVPLEMQNIISDAEYNLENIRFCVSDDRQYDEGLKVVNVILSKIEELQK